MTAMVLRSEVRMSGRRVELLEGGPSLSYAHAARYIDDAPLVVTQDLARQLMLGTLLFADEFVGKGVDIEQHREALRSITPYPEQRVRILCGHPAHDRDGQLSGSIDRGRFHRVVNHRRLSRSQVGQPADHKLL